MKPIIKWVGGKRRQTHQIAATANWDGQGQYIEPFAGGRSLLPPRTRPRHPRRPKPIPYKRLPATRHQPRRNSRTAREIQADTQQGHLPRPSGSHNHGRP